MKKVKSLILAGLLACTLSVGARAGEMGTPGISEPPPPPPPGEMGTPGAPTAAPITQNPSSPNTALTGQSLDGTNPLTLEIVLALIQLL